MNAGAFNASILDFVDTLVVLIDGKIKVVAISELSYSYRSSSLHDSAIVLFVICKYESLRNLKIPSGTTLKSRRDFKQFRAKFLHYDIPNLGSSFKTTDIYSDILTAKVIYSIIVYAPSLLY